jgi:hypothetical protein
MMLPGLMELPLIFMGKPGWSVGKSARKLAKCPGRVNPRLPDRYATFGCVSGR